MDGAVEEPPSLPHVPEHVRVVSMGDLVVQPVFCKRSCVGCGREHTPTALGFAGITTFLFERPVAFYYLSLLDIPKIMGFPSVCV